MTECSLPAVAGAPACAADVGENVTLVATSPAEMQRAQSSLSQWFAAKVEICRRDADDLRQSIEIASQRSIPMPGLERQLRNAERLTTFYEKCRAAIDAGYCIVPNFPIDVFAMRTKKSTPKALAGTAGPWSDERRQMPEGLPPGQGHYVDSLPTQEARDYPSGRKNAEGKEIIERYWHAEDFQEVGFPISISKPQLLDSVGRAMAQRLFDEIGIAPSRKIRRADPIIVGTIRDPRGTRDNPRKVSFLLAWWINTADL